MGQPTGGIPKTREFFLKNVNALYSAYFSRHPKRKEFQSEEEAKIIWEEYAERYANVCSVC